LLRFWADNGHNTDYNMDYNCAVDICGVLKVYNQDS